MTGTAPDPAPSPPGQGPPLRAVTLAVSAAAGLLFLGYPSSRFTNDGVVFSMWVEQAAYNGEFGPLWHPRHLLYAPLGYVFFQGASMLGLDWRAAYLLEIFNALLAAVAVFMFQTWCFRLTRDLAVSAAAGLGLAFSFGFWTFAVQPEVYALNVLAWIACLWAAWQWSAPECTSSWAARAAVLGLLGAFATAAHITSGLLLIVPGGAALWYLRARPGMDPAARTKAGLAPAALMSITALALIGALYGFAYRENPLARGQNFLGWVRGEFNPQTGFGYQINYWDLSAAAPEKWVRAMGDCFLAPAAARLAKAWWLGPLRAMLVAGVIAGAGFYLVRLRKILARQARAQALLALAFFPIAAFSLLWEPGNYEIKTVMLPLIWLGIAQGAAEMKGDARPWARPTVTGAVVVLTAGLFVYNFFGSVRPASDPRLNENLERAFFIRDHTESNAVIYLVGLGEGYNLGKTYIPYFSGRQTRVVDWVLKRSPGPFPGPLQAALAGDRDRRPVYVLSEVIEPGPALDHLGRNHRLDAEEVRRFFLSYNPQPAARREDGFALYRISP